MEEIRDAVLEEPLESAKARPGRRRPVAGTPVIHQNAVLRIVHARRRPVESGIIHKHKILPRGRLGQFLPFVILGDMPALGADTAMGINNLAIRFRARGIEHHGRPAIKEAFLFASFLVIECAPGIVLENRVGLDIPVAEVLGHPCPVSHLDNAVDVAVTRVRKRIEVIIHGIRRSVAAIAGRNQEGAPDQRREKQLAEHITHKVLLSIDSNIYNKRRQRPTFSYISDKAPLFRNEMP